MPCTTHYHRCFLSYSGTGLPLNLVGEIELAETENRNTYFGAQYDDQARELLIHKVVYGEVELEHRYQYYDNGALQCAVIINIDGEEQRLEFDRQGLRQF